MSADIIQAKYDDMEAIASRFGQWAEASNELHSRVKTCTEALAQGGWEGRGSTAFFSEMQGEIFPAVQRLAHALDEARAVMLEAKDIIRQAEEEAARVFADGAASNDGNMADNNKEEESWWGKWGEWVHGGLDVAGLIPVVGEVADGVNAIIYLAEGRYVEAGVSAVSMIPGVGDLLAKGGKYGVKGAMAVGEVAVKGMLKEGAEEMSEAAAKRGMHGITGYAPDRVLPRDNHGVPIPDSPYPHTQLGIRKGRHGTYRQTREWGSDGQLIKDTDWTDHGRPDQHTNPHDHFYEPNSTGGTPKRGGGR